MQAAGPTHSLRFTKKAMTNTQIPHQAPPAPAAAMAGPGGDLASPAPTTPEAAAPEGLPPPVIAPDIALSPAEAEAGAPLILGASIPAEAFGTAVVVHDAAGAEIARFALIPTKDGSNRRSGEARVPAPTAVGRHLWRASIVGAAEVLDPGAEPPATEVAVHVSAHRAALTAWGMPPTAAGGAEVAFRVGLRCTAGCDATGWQVHLRDAAGATLAQAAFTGAVWPGTDGLLSEELRLIAPAKPGLAEWTLTATPPAGTDTQHLCDPVRVRLRTVPPPEHVLTVEAVAAETGAPVEGARVAVHPYRAVTGPDGIARIPVAAGEYTLFVAGKRFIPYRLSGKITADLTLRAELEAELDADIAAGRE